MELWIRSQDRTLLTTVDKIYICQATNNIEYDIIGAYCTLGTYKTKERTLEVLDEIQNMIKPTLINTEYHSEIKEDVDKISFDVVMTPIEDKITYIQPNVVIYEMPKE